MLTIPFVCHTIIISAFEVSLLERIFFRHFRLFISTQRVLKRNYVNSWINSHEIPVPEVARVINSSSKLFSDLMSTHSCGGGGGPWRLPQITCRMYRTKQLEQAIMRRFQRFRKQSSRFTLMLLKNRKCRSQASPHLKLNLTISNVRLGL